MYEFEEDQEVAGAGGGDRAKTLSSRAEQMLLERSLRRKIVLLENSIAKTANNKVKLRENVDSVKKDIRSSFDYLMTCVRSREQQLLASLDNVVSAKEERLNEQLDQFHRALGACQQGLSCLSSNFEEGGSMSELVEANLKETLNRLSSVSMGPMEASVVGFDVDNVRFRRAVETFGRICLLPAAKAILASLKTSESLPADMEDYEGESVDDHSSMQMFHKPFSTPQHQQRRHLPPATGARRNRDEELFREALTGRSGPTFLPPKGCRSSEGARLNSWLRDIKTNVETEPNTMFESAQQENSTNDKQRRQTEAAQVFRTFFATMANSKPNDWLLKSTGAVTSISNKLANTSLSDNHTSSRRSSSVSTGFDVKSNSSEWTYCGATGNSELSNLVKVVPTEDEPANAKKRKHVENDAANWPLEERPADLFRKFMRDEGSGKHDILAPPEVPTKPAGDVCSVVSAGPPMISDSGDIDRWLIGDRKAIRERKSEHPHNACPPEMDTYESVLGWQAILEKIHASGDEKWLLTS